MATLHDHLILKMGSIAHSFLLSLIHRSDMTKILFERIYSSNSFIHPSPEESIVVSLSYINNFIVILYKIFFSSTDFTNASSQ